jgi:hypothetical protein
MGLVKFKSVFLICCITERVLLACRQHRSPLVSPPPPAARSNVLETPVSFFARFALLIRAISTFKVFPGKASPRNHAQEPPPPPLRAPHNNES